MSLRILNRPVIFRHTQTCSPLLSRPFHIDDKNSKSRPEDGFFNKFRLKERRFGTFYENEVAKDPLYGKVDKNLLRSVSQESYYEGLSDAKSTGSGFSWTKVFCLIFVCLIIYSYYELVGNFENTLKFGESDKSEETDYLVETSGKKFVNVRGMDEILSEFHLVVDLLTNPEKYKDIGAKVPKGILLNGKPGTGKTLIAKAIAGEAGVPFLYAAGSQFDEMYVGVGAKRIRKLFEQARENAPCIVFIDEIDAVGGKRKTGGSTSDYSRMTINQLLQEMDGFKSNEDVIVIGATNLKAVLDPALLRPGRFDLVIDVPNPNKKGRKDILRHYFNAIKHNDSINLERLASITGGLNGSQLENIVNQAAIKAVRDRNVEVDTKHLEYAFDKISMGPELLSMEQTPEGMRKTAIHEGGHCLLAYLLHKQGVYDNIPRKATITRRGGALGHVSFQQDEKSDEDSQSLEHMRSHLIVGMGGRAAEALFFGEAKVHTGAISDMQGALRIANSIVCQASGHPDQVKGRLIDAANSSDKQKELVDRLVDEEIDHAYKKATEMLKENSKLHNVLIDAMMKFKTLDLEEIELLMKTRSISAVERSRLEHESTRIKARTIQEESE